MHLGAAQFLIGGHFAGGRLQQRRACEKHLGLVAYSHNVIRQAGLVGAPGGGVAVHHGHLGDAGGGQAGLVGEAPGAEYEDIGGVVEIGAAALGQGHHRQLVLHGDLL